MFKDILTFLVFDYRVATLSYHLKFEFEILTCQKRWKTYLISLLTNALVIPSNRWSTFLTILLGTSVTTRPTVFTDLWMSWNEILHQYITIRLATTPLEVSRGTRGAIVQTCMWSHNATKFEMSIPA